MDRVIRKKMALGTGVLVWTFAFLMLTIGFFQTRSIRKQQELELASLSARNQAVESWLNASAYGFAILDNQGLVIEWNAALEKMTGYTKAEMLGTDITRLMTLEKGALHSKSYAEVINDPKSVSKTFNIPCEVIRKDKPPAMFHVYAQIVKAPLKGALPQAIAMINPERKIVEVIPEEPTDDSGQSKSVGTGTEVPK